MATGGLTTRLRARRGTVVAAVMLAAATGGLVVWSGGFGATVGGADLYAMSLAKHRHTAAALAAGRFPLWNPYEFCGLPLHATAQGSVLYLPVALANMVLPLVGALQVLCHIHLAALTLLTLAYLIRAGLSLPAAVIGAALASACFFNGPARVGPDHPNVLFSMTYVPAILLAWESLLAGRRAAGAWIALLLGVQWLAGYPEFPMDMAVILGLAAVFGCGWSLPRRLSAAAGLIAIGVLIGAAQTVPAWELMGESARISSAEHLQRMRGLSLVPSASILVKASLIRYGAAGLFVVLVGLVTRQPRQAFWVAAFLWAVFPANRPFAYLYELPGYSSIRFLTGWTVLAPFFAGCLAAAGIDRLYRGARGQARWLPPVLGVSLTAGAFWLGLWVPGALATVCTVFVWAPLRARGGWAVPAALVAVHAAVTLAQVGTGSRLPAPDLSQFRQRVELFRHLQRTLPGPPRLVSFTELWGGLFLMERLPSPIGHEPALPPRRLARIAKHLGLDLFGVGAAHKSWTKLAASPGAAAAMGIGLVSLPASRAGPLLRAGYETVARLPDEEIVVYRRPTSRFQIVHHVILAGGEEESFRQLLDPNFDPAAKVILGQSPERAIEPPLGGEWDAEGIDVLEDEPERTRLRAILAAPGVLVMADSFFPGWQARVDGRPQPILRANYAFRALVLDRGQHDVELTYVPLSFTAGLAGSALGLALTLALWIGARLGAVTPQR